MKIDSTRRGERPEHAAHDQLLVARFAAGDVTDAEADAARSLVATCSDCRLLASDLRAIAHATADLPAPARTRDFRLTPERAAALRRPAAINWLSRVVGSGDAFGRLVPLQRLAAAAVAIGLVMAVATSPAGIPGFSTSSGSSKTAAPASETRAAAAAPGLALAPNAAAPSSAAAFPASGSRPAASPAAAAMAAASPAAAAAMAGASPAISSVQVPLAVPSAAPLVGVGRAPTAAPPTAGPPAPSAPAAPAMAGGPSSTAQAPLAATVPSAPQGELGASSEPFGPWQAWLVVAAAGVLVLLVVRLSSRRPT